MLLKFLDYYHSVLFWIYGLNMAEKPDEPSPTRSPRKQPRQFKKCKSATFTLDGMNYVIGNYIYSLQVKN